MYQTNNNFKDKKVVKNSIQIFNFQKLKYIANNQWYIYRKSTGLTYSFSLIIFTYYQYSIQNKDSTWWLTCAVAWLCLALISGRSG